MSKEMKNVKCDCIKDVRWGEKYGERWLKTSRQPGLEGPQ